MGEEVGWLQGRCSLGETSLLPVLLSVENRSEGIERRKKRIRKVALLWASFIKNTHVVHT